MEYKKYKVILTGVTPLLMHKDNLDWGKRVKAWAQDPANKKVSTPGDDRTPAWTWLGYCYFDSESVVIDSDNLMAMLRDAGKKCSAAKGKGSLKAATQSGIIVNEIGWPIHCKGEPISKEMLMELQNEDNFEEHEKLVNSLGFELFTKRAKVGQNKHVRVRPRFDAWTCRGTITVLDPALTPSVIKTLFDQAGRFVGVGDWRPGSPASGRFGMFTTEVEESK